jgi:hypothetical protein
LLLACFTLGWAGIALSAFQFWIFDFGLPIEIAQCPLGDFDLGQLSRRSRGRARGPELRS